MERSLFCDLIEKDWVNRSPIAVLENIPDDFSLKGVVCCSVWVFSVWFGEGRLRTDDGAVCLPDGGPRPEVYSVRGPPPPPRPQWVR